MKMDFLKRLFGKKQEATASSKKDTSMAERKDRAKSATPNASVINTRGEPAMDNQKHQSTTVSKIQALITQLNGTNRDDSIKAAEELEKLEGDEAINALLQASTSSNVNAKLGASLALANMKDERALEPLISLIETRYEGPTQARIVKSLMEALLKLDHLKAVKLLIEALNRKHEDSDVRGRLANMLGELKDELRW